MKILVISNYYPPYFIGGYELGCKDIVDGLRDLGHDVNVLTSTYGVNQSQVEGHVHRRLIAWLTVTPPVGKFARWRKVVENEIKNQSVLKEVIGQFRPDLIYIWNIGFTSLSLATEAERTGIPVCYYISDLWPTRWNSDAAYAMLRNRRGLIRRAMSGLVRAVLYLIGARIPIGPPTLAFAQCTSEYIRRQVLTAGYTPKHDWVIRWAVNLAQFPQAAIKWPPKRILYVGTLSEFKGVHTALAGFAKVANSAVGSEIELSLVGGTIQPEYVTRLRRMAVDLGVANRVSFIGQFPREDLPRIYADHDVLLFPSEWEEPFSITLIEAMASGLAVVATTTGGTPEIVVPRQNGLAFPAGDSVACSDRLALLLTDRELYHSIRQEARRIVESQFGWDRMICQIMDSLKEIVSPCALRNVAYQ